MYIIAFLLVVCIHRNADHGEVNAATFLLVFIRDGAMLNCESNCKGLIINIVHY